MTEKKIEVLELPVSDIKFGFGNPRKPLNKKQKNKLKDSFDKHGDFGVIVIDEHNNVIAGNQRVTVICEENPNQIVLCKRLVGYSTSELRAINIKDNIHEGEWDLDMLAEWTANLSVDNPFEDNSQDVEERKIKDMELIRYEKYDYVVLVCRNEVDYFNLTKRLGIDDKKVLITPKRKIKARAVWYDQIACQIVDKPKN